MPFTEFKKCEKYPWRSDTFSKVILKVTVKVTLFHGCFSRFFKLYKCYQIAQRITCAQSIYVCWWVSQITVFIPFALTFMWVKIVSIYENCVGAKPRFYYFAGCFLYLCKLMLLHLKSIMTFSRYNKNNFCDNWRYHHKNKFYCAIRRWKRNISHFF